MTACCLPGPAVCFSNEPGRGGGGSGYYGDEEIQAGRKVSRGVAPSFLLPPTCPLLFTNPSPLIQVMRGLMKRSLSLLVPLPPLLDFYHPRGCLKSSSLNSRVPRPKAAAVGAAHSQRALFVAALKLAIAFSCLCTHVFALASAVSSAFGVARSNPPTFSFYWIEPWSTRWALNTHPELNCIIH